MLRAPLAAVRTVLAVTIVGLATFMFAAYLIVLMRVRPNTPNASRILRTWARIFLFWTGARVTVEGAEHIDPAGSYVFVGNHSSNLDIPVIVGKLPLSIRFLTKKELFNVPILGGGMRAIDMVETDRRAGPAAHRIINEQVSQVVAKGLSLMVFPEGTRSEDGALLPFKKGAFRIAVDNAMPIAPVTIVGAIDGWRPRSKLIFGGPVRLVIHEPIPTEGLDRTMLNELRDQARAAIDSPLVDSLPPSS
jgi:1-acyl-sn-glycerol-3-phosphate acyltransferase